MNKQAVILFTNSALTEAKLKTNSKTDSFVSLAKNCIEESISHLANKITCNNYELLISSPEQSLFKYLNVDNERRILQKGNSFGERFYNSIKEAFEKGFQKVTIIGNDATVITKKHLIKSFNHSGNNVCIGPSTSGGFYLLAISSKNFKIINKNEFISLPYQTGKAFSELLKLFSQYSIKSKLLERKNYFDCSNELLVVRQFKKILLLIRNELTKNTLLTMANNFIKEVFVVTHSIEFQLSFHKAPPLG